MTLLQASTFPFEEQFFHLCIREPPLQIYTARALMIDTLSIISNGGVVLWQSTSHETGRRAIVNRLIQGVLLEDRAGAREVVVDDYKVRWRLENEAGFMVVAVYPKFALPRYIDSFLRDIVAAFLERFGSDICHPFGLEFNFKEEYEKLLTRLEDTERAVTAGCSEVEPDLKDSREFNAGNAADGAGVDVSNVHDDAEEAHRSGNVFVTKNGKRIGGRSNKGASYRQADTAVATPGGRKGKPGKQPTTWGPTPDAAVAAQAKGPTEAERQAQADMQRSTYIRRLPNGAIAPVKEKEWEGQSRGRLATWLRSHLGNREVDQQDLDRIIPELQEKLVSKNVAVEVAEHVCKSVQTSLAGKKLGTFDSLYSTVEGAMVASLQRILQPKHEVNILRNIAVSKSRMRPYSIVLCGVNGVGKSTSLAKMAYWLLQNNNSVLIAAGDTFRHGAVEQLEVHGRCLDVPVFQMGYGSDPSTVAGAAIAQASRQHTDVVMIDTAGRMQDHESRMRALAKLIHDNQPDLVLFVGEALVGNTGIDQLRRFNQCLLDFSPVGAPSRGIDGIVLTKFDTIDDKVGAALSMVYELGQPIVFVGVGQTYQDLKVIEPDVVVSALMR